MSVQQERATRRREQLYQLLVQAAEADARCPSNQVLGAAVGLTHHTVTTALASLESEGRIIRHGSGVVRVVTITASGKRTVPYCSPVIDAQPLPPKTPVRQIVLKAAELFDVCAKDVLGPPRFREFVRPRFAAIAVAVDQGWSYCHVGRVLSRDHSTIIAARRKSAELARVDPVYAARLAELAAHAAPKVVA